VQVCTIPRVDGRRPAQAIGKPLFGGTAGSSVKGGRPHGQSNNRPHLARRQKGASARLSTSGEEGALERSRCPGKRSARSQYLFSTAECTAGTSISKYQRTGATDTATYSVRFHTVPAGSFFPSPGNDSRSIHGRHTVVEAKFEPVGGSVWQATDITLHAGPSRLAPNAPFSASPGLSCRHKRRNLDA
jgi:hypothetical protein